METKEKNFETLKEYKKSVIFEYVTGKERSGVMMDVFTLKRIIFTKK